MNIKLVLRLISLVLAGVVLLSAAGGALAQSYPTKPIRFLVPYPPGGGNDLLARIIGQKLSDSLGQQVVIDNRPGASGNIGTEMAAKAAPDGHTIMLADNIFTINPSLYGKLPYDPVKDFAPVSLLATVPLFLVLNPSVPAKSLKEFIALVKSKPGQLNYASVGNGSLHHLAMELIKVMVGIDIVHIPYKGGAPARADILAGQVQAMFSGISSVPLFKAGRLNAIAVSTAKRSWIAPELPTVAEAAIPGFNVGVWFGVLAPAKTPKAIIAKLHTEIVKLKQMPEVQERLKSDGYDFIGGTPESFAAFIKTDIEKMAKAVKFAGARVD